MYSILLFNRYSFSILESNFNFKWPYTKLIWKRKEVNVKRFYWPYFKIIWHVLILICHLQKFRNESKYLRYAKRIIVYILLCTYFHIHSQNKTIFSYFHTFKMRHPFLCYSILKFKHTMFNFYIFNYVLIRLI